MSVTENKASHLSITRSFAVNGGWW